MAREEVIKQLSRLRGYKRRSDEDWIRLYNYCIARSHLRQTHLYLETKEMAALCGTLGDKDVVDRLIRPTTSKQFLNHAATSTYDAVETAGVVRQTTTALFTDFEIIRKSGSKKSNKTNIQMEMDYSFGWGHLHHESVMDSPTDDQHKCFDVIARALKFVNQLVSEEDIVRAGASVHMWFSFGEFVQWNKDGNATRFVFESRILRKNEELAGRIRSAHFRQSMHQQQFLSWHRNAFGSTNR